MSDINENKDDISSSNIVNENSHSKINTTDKNTTNQFQESSTLSLLQQNISEVNLEESQSKCLRTAGEQLKQHLNSSCGFSNLDEYNSHIVPPRKTLGNIQHNIITSPIDNTEPSLTSNVINNQNYSTVTETSNMVLNKPFKTMSAPENISTSQSEDLLLYTYEPIKWHWFYCKYAVKNKWVPFSQKDSDAIEQAFILNDQCNESVIATDGSRFDVYLNQRIRKPVYWSDNATNVRRCSWFLRNSNGSNFIPYDEVTATLLEEEYKIAWESNEWGRRVPVGNYEEVVFHSPTAIIHNGVSISILNNSEETQTYQMDQAANISSLKQCIVKRGFEEFVIPSDEPSKVDHLLFIVHGIGSYCDLKMRPIYEVVDDFRSLALQLTQSHFKTSCQSEKIGRIEVLPVSWHLALHSEDIDCKLKRITLPSIPRLRNFSNDTILDVLFYTSPTFCQTIINAVGNEMNRMYSQYLLRNPNFNGHVSIGGHSLGSLISFDLLCNQQPPSPTRQTESSVASVVQEQKAKLSRGASYVTLGKAGTGQPYITYPQLKFQLDYFFGFGSPIGMFVTVRGIESLGENFKFPTCPGFLNIFHPYDPVAYRIEPLINTAFENIPPFQVPHHKGRKRMHLELKDTMAHVGAALKTHLVNSVRNTWNTVYQLAMFSKATSGRSIEYDSRIKLDQKSQTQQADSTSNSKAFQRTSEYLNIKPGILNKGNRVDCVLQEAPIESFNEYLFAVGSHLCYWESEDTILLVLKEIYSIQGVSPDNQIQHAILPFDIHDSDNSDYPTSMQFEEPPGFNMSFGSLSSLYDDKC
ncbi:phospholipase DDHD2-like isoform X1 [Rhopalosiphum padi]|uniref:phospholipase DDHD2-like isoform X1 n=1 Tax=Rhopalosiphum padi TaxID=40932 RepID=UPI00298E58A5|nr:phospholipase DDHD2-like isoform X1 [Rhopalosiphum padi]